VWADARLNYFIIAFVAAALHLDAEKLSALEREMKAIHKVMMASAVAISAFAFFTIAGSPAQGGPNVPAGHYCMVWALGGSDCSFTSYAECLETA